MRFTVPQFIEYEAKIIGPFTFKQFIYIGSAGAVLFILYFSIPFFIFLILALGLGGLALALAYFKIGGRPLPTVLANFLKFTASPKVYIWKKGLRPEVIKKAEIKKKEELPTPKVGGESQLKKLSTEVETKK